jgi:hypothetical protein
LTLFKKKFLKSKTLNNGYFDYKINIFFRDFLRRHRPTEFEYEDEELEEEEEEEEEEGEDDHEEEEEVDGSREYLQPRKKKSSIVMYQNLETAKEMELKKLTLRDLVHFAAQVSRGMEFLASKKVLRTSSSPKVLSYTYIYFYICR